MAENDERAVPTVPPAQGSQLSIAQYGFIIAAIVIPILSFLGGSCARSVEYTNSLATKNEVADAVKSLKSYTDDKAESLRNECHAYTDEKIQKLELEFVTSISGLRTDVTAQTTKMDLVLRSVQQMRDDAFREATGRKRRDQ